MILQLIRDQKVTQEKAKYLKEAQLQKPLSKPHIQLKQNPNLTKGFYIQQVGSKEANNFNQEEVNSKDHLLTNKKPSEQAKCGIHCPKISSIIADN